MEHGNLLNWLIFLPDDRGGAVPDRAQHRAVKIIAVVGHRRDAAAVAAACSSTSPGGAGTTPASIFGGGYGQKLYEVTKLTWITLGSGRTAPTIEYFVGVDGLSFPLVILTTFVTFLACLASWNIEHWKINRGIRGYFALFLLLETGMLGVFCRPGLLPVLHLLGSDAAADVLPHRRVGRAAEGIRRHQVLHLHPGRLGADAGRAAGVLLLRPGRPPHVRPDPLYELLSNFPPAWRMVIITSAAERFSSL